MRRNKIVFDHLFAAFEGSKLIIAKKMAETAKDYFVLSFDSTSWDSNSWAPLKQATLDYKLSKYNSTTPLVNTGDLRDALENCIEEVNENHVLLVVKTDYSSFQNDGTKTIPKRTFFDMSYTLEEQLKDLIMEELEKLNNVK